MGSVPRDSREGAIARGTIDLRSSQPSEHAKVGTEKKRKRGESDSVQDIRHLKMKKTGLVRRTGIPEMPRMSRFEHTGALDAAKVRRYFRTWVDRVQNKKDNR